MRGGYSYLKYFEPPRRECPYGNPQLSEVQPGPRVLLNTTHIVPALLPEAKRAEHAATDQEFSYLSPAVRCSTTRKVLVLALSDRTMVFLWIRFWKIAPKVFWIFTGNHNKKGNFASIFSKNFSFIEVFHFAHTLNDIFIKKLGYKYLNNLFLSFRFWKKNR